MAVRGAHGRVLCGIWLPSPLHMAIPSLRALVLGCRGVMQRRLSSYLGCHAATHDHGDVGQGLAEAGEPKVNEHAATLEVLALAHVYQ